MFDKVVFAGGGSRCWWQAGFWDAVHARIELRPRLIAGAGAGAAMACLLHATATGRVLAWYERALGGPDGQWHWGNLLRPGQRVMPHEALHRKALRSLLGGDRFRELMWTAPEIRVQFARLPAGGHPAWLTARGLARLAFDRPADPRLPTPGVRRQGLRPEQRRIQDCQSERELVDLLVAAASLPPFTRLGRIGNTPVLDGGLLGVPVDAVADVPGSTLVLLTRHYRDLAPVFARDGRLYVQPSRPIGVAAWDHGSARRFRQAYDLGVADADAFLRVFALDRAPGIERDTVEIAGAGAGAVAPAPGGRLPAGQVPAGQVPAGQVSAGQMPLPDAPIGDLEPSLAGLPGTGGLPALAADAIEPVVDGAMPLSGAAPAAPAVLASAGSLPAAPMIEAGASEPAMARNPQTGAGRTDPAANPAGFGPRTGPFTPSPVGAS